MGRASRIGEVLTDVTSSDRPLGADDLDGVDTGALLDSAVHHRIAGLLHDRLQRATGLDRSLDNTLAALALQARARHLRAVADVHASGRILEAADVPWLVVKGPVLAEAVYPRPGLRWYGDIDIVVPRGAFRAAVTALQHQGAPLKDQNWLRVREQVAGQLNLSAPGGTALDLHWHLLFGAGDRAQHGVDMEELFERSQDVDLGGTPVRTTDAVDTLLHVAMHACAEGADRLVWLTDVQQVVTRWAPDWDEVVTRATQWRVGPAVGLVLGRCRRAVGLDVPAEVLTALVPTAGWRAAQAAVDRLFPVAASDGRLGSPASLLARSTGPGASATTAALGARITERIRWARRTRSLARPSGAAFPEELGSPYVATGDETDLEAFFSELEATSPQEG